MPRKKRSEVEAEALEALNRATDQVMGREPTLETAEDVRELATAAHKAGLKVGFGLEPVTVGDEDDGAPDAAAEGFALDPDGYAQSTGPDLFRAPDEDARRTLAGVRAYLSGGDVDVDNKVVQDIYRLEEHFRGVAQHHIAIAEGARADRERAYLLAQHAGVDLNDASAAHLWRQFQGERAALSTAKAILNAIDAEVADYAEPVSNPTTPDEMMRRTLASVRNLKASRAPASTEDIAADLAATPTRMAPAWCRAYPEAALAVYQAIASGKVKIATWKGRALVSATGETVGSVLLTPNGYGARFGRSERDDDGPEDVCRAWAEAAAVADGWMVLP